MWLLSVKSCHVRNFNITGNFSITNLIFRYFDVPRNPYGSQPKPLPESFDWRQNGCNFPVKDQGVCGCSFAFATVGAMECAVKLKDTSAGDLDFSEQQLLDCSRFSCETGGEMAETFMKLAYRAIANESSVPYTGRKADYCHYNLRPEDYMMTNFGGYSDFRYNAGEKQMERDLVENGPLAVSIGVFGSNFRTYDGGIFDDPEECSSEEKPNHAVLVVGYGIDGRGNKFW